MNWLDYMNSALDYIEDNLSIRIDYDKIAAKAGCSTYNFQRMFSFIADVSLANYVRRRCMTIAAQELSKGEKTVLEVAMEFGYDSPVSFARAFQSIQGMTPKEARREGAKLKLYPRISFQISIKGAESMKYRIETMKPFSLAGVSKEISTVNNENFKAVPKMWDDVCGNGGYKKLCTINEENNDMYGVCYDFNFKEEKLRYMIAMEAGEHVPDEYDKLEIPEFTWVKFECNGTEGLQDVFKRLYTEWFPTSGYEHADGPEIEWYPSEDMGKPNYKCEVWIPIVPAKNN